MNEELNAAQKLNNASLLPKRRELRKESVELADAASRSKFAKLADSGAAKTKLKIADKVLNQSLELQQFWEGYPPHRQQPTIALVKVKEPRGAWDAKGEYCQYWGQYCYRSNYKRRRSSRTRCISRFCSWCGGG
jgi:hypothetical protein